jgi:hypothetical protein
LGQHGKERGKEEVLEMLSKWLKSPSAIITLRTMIVGLSVFLLQMIPDHIYQSVGLIFGYKVLLITILILILIAFFIYIKFRYNKPIFNIGKI